MLMPDRLSAFNFTYDNWGANPSATIGTSVVPGASNAQGSWTQIASSSNIAQECFWLYMQIHNGAISTAARPQLMDIGIDPAGGTSYTAFVSDMQIGMSPAITQSGAREHIFPIRIPAGSSVAVRVRGANATAGAVRIAARFYGAPTNPLAVPVVAFSETLGANTGTSTGTTFTPGNATDGSWVDLGATAKAMWWWQLGYCVNNSTITAEYTYIDVAWGDGSNKHSMFRVMHGGTTSETCGLSCQTQMLSCAAYNPVPAGANIYIRGRCVDAPDTGPYSATVTGIGG